MISSKHRVLYQILKVNEGYISGQEIAEKLGISRTAVNKAVTAIKAEGYRIDAVNRMGYRIRENPNRINFGELLNYLDEERIDKIAIYDKLLSTNVTLHELAEKGAENGQVVIASSQTAGRGREGGTFDSPDNKSIYMSYLIVPNGKIDIKKVTPKAADAVRDCLNEMLEAKKISIEYPGSLYLGKKKICGILTEVLLEAESNYIRYLMVGIGVRPVEDIKRAEFTARLIKKLDNEL